MSFWLGGGLFAASFAARHFFGDAPPQDVVNELTEAIKDLHASSSAGGGESDSVGDRRQRRMDALLKYGKYGIAPLLDFLWYANNVAVYFKQNRQMQAHEEAIRRLQARVDGAAAALPPALT